MTTSANRGFVTQMLVYPLLAIGFTGSIGVAAVWMRHQIAVTADANRVLETKLTEVGRLSQQTATWIAEEEDQTELLRKNVAMRLGMMPPQADQVERITVDPVKYLAHQSERGLFREEIESVSFRVALQH